MFGRHTYKCKDFLDDEYICNYKTKDYEKMRHHLSEMHNYDDCDDGWY